MARQPVRAPLPFGLPTKKTASANAAASSSAYVGRSQVLMHHAAPSASAAAASVGATERQPIPPASFPCWEGEAIVLADPSLSTLAGGTRSPCQPSFASPFGGGARGEVTPSSEAQQAIRKTVTGRSIRCACRSPYRKLQ